MTLIQSDQGDKESSVAEPGTSEDLAAVLDAAADTPTLTKRNSATGKRVEIHSMFAN
jgi:hypothetical protein